MSGASEFTLFGRTPEEWLDVEAERNSLRRTLAVYARHRPSAARCTPPAHHPKGNPPVTELQALERCYTLTQDRNAELADMVARLTVENVRLRRELGHG